MAIKVQIGQLRSLAGGLEEIVKKDEKKSKLTLKQAERKFYVIAEYGKEKVYTRKNSVSEGKLVVWNEQCSFDLKDQKFSTLAITVKDTHSGSLGTITFRSDSCLPKQEQWIPLENINCKKFGAYRFEVKCKVCFDDSESIHSKSSKRLSVYKKHASQSKEHIEVPNSQKAIDVSSEEKKKKEEGHDGPGGQLSRTSTFAPEKNTAFNKFNSSFRSSLRTSMKGKKRVSAPSSLPTPSSGPKKNYLNEVEFNNVKEIQEQHLSGCDNQSQERPRQENKTEKTNPLNNRLITGTKHKGRVSPVVGRVHSVLDKHASLYSLESTSEKKKVNRLNSASAECLSHLQVENNDNSGTSTNKKAMDDSHLERALDESFSSDLFRKPKNENGQSLEDDSEVSLTSILLQVESHKNLDGQRFLKTHSNVQTALMGLSKEESDALLKSLAMAETLQVEMDTEIQLKSIQTFACK
eukprot:Awhi_evm1s10157